MLALPQVYRNVLRPLPPVPSTVPIYKTTLTTTTNETTSTFSSVDIGTPHPKRIVILAMCAGAAAATTITVNGINGYLGTVGSGSFRIQSFCINACAVPNDTTATITISTTGSIRKTASVYIAYPANSMPMDWGTANQTTTTDANVANLKAQAGGFLIYSGGQLATLGTFTTTWNGTNGTLQEDVDAQLEAATSYTTGMIPNFTRSSDQDDLNMAESVSGTKQLVAATWGPAYGAYV